MSEELVKQLRDFGKAYPVDMFPEVTDADRDEQPALISRASAAMGRHMAQFTIEAADEIERLSVDAQRYRWLRYQHQIVDPVCSLIWRNKGKWVETADLDTSIDAAMDEQRPK